MESGGRSLALRRMATSEGSGDSGVSCDDYGWCCTAGNYTVTVGDGYELPVFQVLLSVLLLCVMVFLVVKLALGYREVQRSVVRQSLLSSTDGSQALGSYSTFEESVNGVRGVEVAKRMDLRNYTSVTSQSDAFEYSDIGEGHSELFFDDCDDMERGRDARDECDDYDNRGREGEEGKRGNGMGGEYKREIGGERENNRERMREMERKDTTPEFGIGFTQYERMYEEKERKSMEQSGLEKRQLRPSYYVYLLAACLWFLLEALLVLIPPATGPLARTLDIILYEGHVLLDNYVIVLAMFPSDRTRHQVLSLAICAVLLVVISVLAGLTFVLTTDCDTCDLFFPAPQAFFVYTVMTVVYGLCIIGLYSRFGKPRSSVKYWLWFLISVNAVASVGSGAVYFLDQDAGFCIVNFIAIWYTLGYAPILYITLVRDSAALTAKDVVASPVLHVNPAIARAHELVKRHSVGWIPFDSLIVGPRLGVGAAGEVYKAMYLQTPVAVKKLFDTKNQTIEDFFREVTVMSKLTHPNIVLFMGVCVRDNGERYIVTEMMNKGSVFDLIHPNLSFSAIRDPEADNELNGPRIKAILVQCARGMAYLHSFRPPMLHRDLKSHNLLVDDNWNVKVADFGLSRPQSLNTMTAAGTPQWSAPEVIRQDRYTEKADVYSFGIITYELLSRQIPYVNMAPLTAAHRVGYDGLRPTFPRNVDPRWAAFAQDCWEEEPDVRPTFEEAVKCLEEMPPPVI